MGAGDLLLWNPPNAGFRSMSWGQPYGQIISLAWSPTGKQIVTGGPTIQGIDSEVMIWDIDKGTLLGFLPRQESGVKSVAWSADGRIIASGCNDGKVRIWSVRVP
jgi:WD40 repeat protein